MKKFLSIAAAILALTLVLALPMTSFAATREEVIAKVREAVPAKQFAEYQVQLENALDTLAPTDEQCDALLTLVDEAGELAEGKGDDLSLLDAATKNLIVEKFDQACQTLGVTLSVYADSGDQAVFRVYKSDGTILTELDPTPVKTTGAPASEQSLALPALAGLLVVLSAGCFVAGKRIGSAI